MPETPAIVEIPDFQTFIKQRKQGKKEKRRFGIPWWPNLSAVQGLGFGAQLGAVLGSGVGISALCVAMCVTAGAVGLIQKNRIRAQRDAIKKKQFEASLLRDHILKHGDKMKSAVPTVDGARNDTVGFVFGGGLPGEGVEGGTPTGQALTGEPAGEGKGAGEAGGAKDGDGAAPMDPNALAAQMMAQAGGADAAAGAKAAAGAAASSIGKLSQGMGGGRSGGGMTAGGGRGMSADLRNAAALGKAQGFRGGQEAGLKDNKLRRGNPRKWEARGSRTAAARSGATAKRLARMAADMSANRTGDVAKAASANTAAWEKSAAPGQVTQGPGAAIPGASGDSGGGVGAFPTAPEGGPVNVGDDFDTGDLKTNVPTIPDYQEATPYQWAVDLAKMLIYGIIAASLIVAALRATGYGLAAVPAIIKAIALMGGLLAALGVYMIAMDQYWQGTMYTILGGIVAITALAAPETQSISATKTALAGAAMALPLLVTDAAYEADTEDFIKEEEDNYRKQYGVDPKTKQVLNRQKFDDRYGEGAADDWDKQRQYDDMR